MKTLNSAIYRGKLSHKRLSPKLHQFQYGVFMMYLDLNELDLVLEQSSFWSLNKSNIASFQTTDYLQKLGRFESGMSLKEAVITKIKNDLNIDVDGVVTLLTNVRLLGYQFNPISIFYCFDVKGHLLALLLEVTNTPWKEKHCYALACDPGESLQRISFHKQFHVSPFQEMTMQYFWKSTSPGQELFVSMTSRDLTQITDDGIESVSPVFNATLSLSREPVTSLSLNGILIRFPMMTFKVISAIYWQALKLFIKRIAFVKHPE